MDDIVQVRQIAQYPRVATTAPTDVALLQQVGVGGAYVSILTPNLVGSALGLLPSLKLAAGTTIAWNGASLSSDGVGFSFNGSVNLPTLNAGSITAAGSIYAGGDIFVAGEALATQVYVTELFDSSVVSFNGRSGFVQLETADVLRAGGAPIENANFGGICTAPTPWDFRADSDQIATTAFVQLVIEQLICGGSIVSSFNGRGGDVILSTADVNAAFAVAGPPWPTAPSPALGDSSNRIATTIFVDESIADAISEAVFIPDLALYAPLASPAFSGIPTAPTANVGTATGQIATTAFVQAAVVAATTGVTSFNTRTGAITLTLADLTAAGGAPLVSPNFTGVPMAPTAPTGTSSQQLATTAFVLNEIGAIAAGVASFNGRSGNVTLTTADVTGAGGAPIASPTFTGVPAGPTAAAATNTTQLATTAFVLANSVLSFNGRQGAVSLTNNDVTAAGGAVTNSPTFTGVPLAPTAAANTATTQLATTAFVMAAIAAVGGVATFNGRAGAVTLSLADITGAGGAPLASPTFTGTPAAPTAAPGTSTTQLATTAFATAAAAIQPGNRVLIQRQDASGSPPYLTFSTGISGYDLYELDCYNLVSLSESGWNLQMSPDGVTWIAGANDYWYGYNYAQANNTGGVAGNAATALYLGGMGTVGSYGSMCSIKLALLGVAGVRKSVEFASTLVNSSGGVVLHGGGQMMGATTYPTQSNIPIITALRLFFATGNIGQGTVCLYGIKK